MIIGYRPTSARGDPEQGQNANQTPIPLQSQPPFRPPPNPQQHAEAIETAPPGYYEESPLNRPPPVYQKTQTRPGFRFGDGVAPVLVVQYGPETREAAEKRRRRTLRHRLLWLLAFVCGIGVLFAVLGMLREFQ